MLALVLVALQWANIGAQAPAPAGPPAGVTRMPVLDNDTVTLTRFRFAPGAKEMPHTHPFSMLTVQLTRGELDLLNGPSHTTRTVEAGNVERFPTEITHANANVGAMPWDLMGVVLKKKVEAATVRSSSTPFAPTSQSAQQSNRFDLVIIPLAPAQVELKLGNDGTTASYEAGSAIFVPRDTRYSVRNAGSTPFTAVTIEIP